jgi:hypothetical protein
VKRREKVRHVWMMKVEVRNGEVLKNVRSLDVEGKVIDGFLSWR